MRLLVLSDCFLKTEVLLWVMNFSLVPKKLTHVLVIILMDTSSGARSSPFSMKKQGIVRSMPNPYQAVP
jgi:hypothetical protein